MVKTLCKLKFKKDEQGNVIHGEANLLKAHEEVHLNPSNVHFINVECHMSYLLKKAKEERNSILRQKAKIAWLTIGDENTKFFHHSIMQRRRTNTINVLHLEDGMTSDPLRIQMAFRKYYMDLLCTDINDQRKKNMNVVHKGHTLTEAQQGLLSLNFSEEEIKKAMWSFPDDKALGIDGFNSGFYKAAWPVVGKDVTDTIRNFFAAGALPNLWKVTTITLIPKIKCPNIPKDYKAFSCCNVVYKCISKLICSKLKLMLNDIISQNQNAFVEERSILHNILLCQDVVKHYGRKNFMSSCLLKIDRRKAYDTLNWDFLKDIMIALNFPHRFVKIIMSCVTSTHYSLIVNGTP